MRVFNPASRQDIAFSFNAHRFIGERVADGQIVHCVTVRFKINACHRGIQKAANVFRLVDLLAIETPEPCRTAKLKHLSF